jgi:hypothetical protein
MGPTVAIWLRPESNEPTADDLTDRATARRTSNIHDSFHVRNTEAIGGATQADESQSFGLALGAIGLDELELRAVKRLLGFRPEQTVHAFAFANATVDHRILVEDAEQADDEFYASLTPEERLDILLELVERHRSGLGEAASRFERVHRIVELSQC